MDKGTKLEDFLLSNTNLDLAKLLLSLAEGCKVIARMVDSAGLNDLHGATDNTNTHGESVQKLDELSDRILMDYLRAGESCAGYLSEETETINTLNTNAPYVVSADPLDGSSNIDVVAPVGTIFVVNERLSALGSVNEADFLQKGTQAKAAGYVIYGSSTMLVFTLGNGVFGFTLNLQDNGFYLSHPNIQTPASGKVYSINQGNAAKFGDGVNNFIAYCTAVDAGSSRPYSLRYIGSMVGDFHRNLLKGGIFIYPANKGETRGKLRLLYECIPMSVISEQAGGKSTNGSTRLLEIQPTDVHERCAIFIGSKSMVDKAMEFQS